MNGEQKTYKINAISKIIIWSVVLAVLVGVFTFSMLLNGGYFDNFNGIFSIVSGYTYSDERQYNIGDASYSDRINEIDIDWTAGKVYISIYEGDEFKIEENGAGGEKENRMRTRVVDGTLYVKYVKSGIRLFSNVPSKGLYIYIPAEYVSRINNISIDTVSAELFIEEDVMCRELDIDGVSGKMDISSLTADRVDIDTVSGNINITGEIGELKVSGVSAKVNLELDSTPKNINMDTVSGDVILGLPEGASFEAELDSVSGDIYLGGKKVGTYCKEGSGGAEFDFNTVSGDIKITLK